MEKGKKSDHRNNRSNDKPKIREVKIEENFFDDEDEKGDKRLIVFAVIAILVILATIVTLVVGCDKKKQEEPKKPNEDIVVPEKKSNDEDNNDDGVVTPEIVRKVTASYKGSKTKESDKEDSKYEENNEKENNTQKYNVTYYLNEEEIQIMEIDQGKGIEPYIPEGYFSCKYYSDEEYENEISLDSEVTEDMHVHMTCELITYTIEYDQETENIKTYTVEDIDSDLLDLDDEEFAGWFLDMEYQNQVTTLNKDIIKYADENNVIHIYAMFGGHSIDCEGESCEIENPSEEPIVAPTETEPTETEPADLEDKKLCEGVEYDNSSCVENHESDVNNENKEDDNADAFVSQTDENSNIDVNDEIITNENNIIELDEKTQEDKNTIISQDPPTDKTIKALDQNNKENENDVINPEEENKEENIQADYNQSEEENTNDNI